MSCSARSRSYAPFLRITALGWLVLPLACAVAIDPELNGDDAPLVTSGRGGSSGGRPGPTGSTAGTKSAFGGTSAMTGGSPSTGKGGTSNGSGGAASAGTSSSAGKSSGGAGGKVGSGGSGGGSGGTTTAGSAGTGSAGKGGSGSGGASTGCGDATPWKGADSTLTIAEGEAVSWMGKRYIAMTNIAYPNAECAPDAPAMWCADWFMADGDC